MARAGRVDCVVDTAARVATRVEATKHDAKHAIDALYAAVSRGSDFVAAHGTPLDRLRLRVLLKQTPDRELLAHLEAQQLETGGFPPPDVTRGRDAELDGTRCALALLADLRALRGPGVERAVSYLCARQRDDGAWSPGPEASESDVVTLTGMLAGYLARAPSARAASVEAAGAFLAAAFSPERVQGDAWDSLAAFAHFFANVDCDLQDAALQWCGRELERGYRTGLYDAARTARVFTLCEVQALPGARIDGAQLVPALLAQQAEDGGFPAGPGGSSGTRVTATLDACLAWLRFGAAHLGAARRSP